MNAWDLALIIVVSLMGTFVAYIRCPERKAFILMLPIPFSLAFLALDRPLDATNVLAMLLMFGFSYGNWFLHTVLRLPIAPTILLSACLYCAGGMMITATDPISPMLFWSSVVVAMMVALALIKKLPYRQEPHHRTPLPIWVKLPIIALVITLIVLLKQQLGGFMTMFPMVGVVAAYEARKSLWTIVRRIPWVIALMTPAMVAIRIMQPHVTPLMALATGWAVYVPLLWLFYSRYHRISVETPSTCADTVGVIASNKVTYLS